jgi:hypothetical protein
METLAMSEEPDRIRLIQELREQRPELSLQEATDIIEAQYQFPPAVDENVPSELALTLAQMAEQATNRLNRLYARYLWRAASDIAAVDGAYKTSQEYENRARATFDKEWQA